MFARSFEKFRTEQNIHSSFLGFCLYIVHGCIVICEIASFGGDWLLQLSLDYQYDLLNKF